VSDLAEKIRSELQQRLDTERAKTRDVVKSYCPTCGEHAASYSIGDMTDVTDMMKMPVKLYPCTHTVVWDTIRREPDTVSEADENLVRLYEKDKQIAERCQHVIDSHFSDDFTANDLAADILSDLARGYGVQPTPGDDHA
jgi:hypothetical protein